MAEQDRTGAIGPPAAGATLERLDPRVPDWDPMRLLARRCPVCDGADSEPVCRRPDELNVTRCTGCLTFRVDPAPDERALAEFYRTYHASHFADTPLSLDEWRADLDSRDPLDDPRIRVIASRLPLAGARVLDVGCGKGKLLHGLGRLGARTVGVEIDPLAASFARGLGVEHVHEGYLDDYVPDEPFDLVTMMDVVEHPLDPVALMERATTWLRPGGLLVLYTPNGDRPERDAERVTFRVDLEHMQYLGARSMACVAARLGLDVVHLEALGFPSVADLLSPERARRPYMLRRLKGMVRTAPGYALANALRRGLRPLPDPRSGDYHLLCAMRRPPDGR